VPTITLPKSCACANVIVAIPEEFVTDEISNPCPTAILNLSVVSLVILFFLSLVTILPSGVLLANVLEDGGL